MSYISIVSNMFFYSFRKLESLRTAYVTYSLSVNFFLFKTLMFLVLGRKMIISTAFSPKTTFQILRDCKVRNVYNAIVYSTLYLLLLLRFKPLLA